MDKRPVEANAPTNDPAQATQKMDMQLAKCRLGVAYIDIVKIQNPLLFGKYNNRPQVEREVNKLIASFKKEGILAMRGRHCYTDYVVKHTPEEWLAPCTQLQRGGGAAAAIEGCA